QIRLEFNDSIINVTRWICPHGDPDFFMPEPPTATELPTSPDPGYVHLAPGKGYIKISVSKGGLPPSPPWGHSGKMAIIEFNITAVPTEPGRKYASTLMINNSDTYLLDPYAYEILGVSKENGYYEISKPGPKYTLEISTTLGGTTNPAPGLYLYEMGTIVTVTAIPSLNYLFDHWELNETNIGSSNPTEILMDANYRLKAFFIFSPPTGARIFIDPQEVIKPDAIPCQTTFQINVSIDDIAEMKACKFNLTYNTNIISLVGLNFPSINGQYPIISLIINDANGFAWMNLTYPTAITVSEPAPLVTLTFHVESMGATPLNLTETILSDILGNPIPHDVYNGFFMGIIRDIAVTNIEVSRTWTYVGWPVNITVTVKNKGNIDETFNLYVYYDSYVIGVETITSLPPNQEKNVTFTWDTTGVAEGNYTIKAEAPPVPYETNVGDNTLTDGKVWVMTHFHDVAIIDITFKNWIYQGGIVQINVTAQNMGDFTETFDIKAYYNTTIIGTIHVTNLAPGSSYTAQFTLNTSTLTPCHTYIISGEATIIPYEYNEENNFLVGGTLKIRIIGDVNGDNKVDLKDVFAVSLAFGSYPGHPDWDPDMDLNYDNKIDLRDVFAVALNFGKECSQ
ncbi:MAG: hypothetical protein KIH09_16550, partial [Candidatus Freyarchaeota archaeon]|nr:hypothetical protein [Candidatus Jordarchaeia archaeon]